MVSYAFTHIHSETDQSGFLWVGSDDGVKIWLNGEEVWINPSSGSHKLAEDKVPISLNAGENRLLVKVKNEVGSYAFSVAAVDEDGDTLPGIYYHTELPTGVTEFSDARGTPERFALMQNYPNPFNPQTTIGYDLSEDGVVKLTVYSVTGRKVAELVNEYQEAGRHTIAFDGSEYGNGVYLYHLEAGGYEETRRMVLIK